MPPRRYLSYIQDKPSKAAPLFAVLRDSAQAVLSVSPVINAEHCKVTPETQQVRAVLSFDCCFACSCAAWHAGGRATACCQHSALQKCAPTKYDCSAMLPRCAGAAGSEQLAEPVFLCLLCNAKASTETYLRFVMLLCRCCWRSAARRC